MLEYEFFLVKWQLNSTIFLNVPHRAKLGRSTAAPNQLAERERRANVCTFLIETQKLHRGLLDMHFCDK